MSGAREQILGRVHAALAPLPARAPLPDWDADLARVRSTALADDPWTLFAGRLKAVNGTPLASLAELVALLVSNKWMHGYCDPALWPRLRPGFPAEIVVETTFDRARLDDYAFGITAAVGAIAETGTIILGDRTTSSRLGALAPWVHVAVVATTRILPDLHAALAAMPDDPNLIWVTGPSKTADIEGILIEGVHGPGMQIALRDAAGGNSL